MHRNESKLLGNGLSHAFTSDTCVQRPNAWQREHVKLLRLGLSHTFRYTFLNLLDPLPRLGFGCRSFAHSR